MSLRAHWFALALLLSPQAASAQDVVATPAPTDPSFTELAHDDASIPPRMRVLLAQTEGVGARNLPETTELASEPIARGDLVSVRFEYARTGVIAADYRSRTILTGSVSIPAGTPVYASFFERMGPTDLPLRGMWCAAAYRGPVTEVGERGICFAGANDRAVLFPVARAQSPYAVRGFDMRNVHNGGFPQIEERPLDVELRRYVVVDGVEGSLLNFHIEEGEASRRSIVVAYNHADVSNGGGQFRWEGGRFAFSVGDDGRVSVTQIDPIEVRDSTLHWHVYRAGEDRFVMSANLMRYEIDGERETFTNLADWFAERIRNLPQPPPPQ